MKIDLTLWHKDTNGGRFSYEIDERFKRRILVLFNTFYIWESIRVIQKNKGDKIETYYFRSVGVKTYGELPPKGIKLLLYKWLTKIVNKWEEIKNIKRNKKYLNKYPFIEELFIDVKRSRVLKELLYESK